MKKCCKDLLKAIKIVQEVRIQQITMMIGKIRKKGKKTAKELRMEVVLTCWKREAEMFLKILKEIKT